MRFLELMLGNNLTRPFDASAESRNAHSMLNPNGRFFYYETLRPDEAIALINLVTRKNMKRDELLKITVVGNETFLQVGKREDEMKPLAYFRGVFSFGERNTTSNNLRDALVNMAKTEMSSEVMDALYGRLGRYQRLEILLARKTAIVPKRLLSRELPVISQPLQIFTATTVAIATA